MASANVSTVTLQSILTTTEVLQGVPGAVGGTVINDDFNQSVSLTPTGSVPVTKGSYQTYTIAGGLVDIDLTALLGTQSNVDGTGLKLQALFIKNLGNNNINVAPGAANAYSPFGAGNDIDLPANATNKSHILLYTPELLADVAAGAKMIRITGTNGDTVQVGILLG